jgi:hypothetical protein
MRSSAARRRRAESGCLNVSRCGCRPDLSLRGSSKSEDYAIEINPRDDCLDHPGMPVRREEIDAPVRPLCESLREADLGPTGTQVDNWQLQQPAFARFKDDRRPADLARMASQLGRLLSSRLAAGFVGEHGGRKYRRHRASRRAGDKLPDRRELSSRAIFALSTGLPTMGFAMLDQPRTQRHAAEERARLAKRVRVGANAAEYP